VNNLKNRRQFKLFVVLVIFSTLFVAPTITYSQDEQTNNELCIIDDLLLQNVDAGVVGVHGEILTLDQVGNLPNIIIQDGMIDPGTFDSRDNRQQGNIPNFDAVNELLVELRNGNSSNPTLYLIVDNFGARVEPHNRSHGEYVEEIGSAISSLSMNEPVDIDRIEIERNKM